MSTDSSVVYFDYSATSPTKVTPRNKAKSATGNADKPGSEDDLKSKSTLKRNYSKSSLVDFKGFHLQNIDDNQFSSEKQSKRSFQSDKLEIEREIRPEVAVRYKILVIGICLVGYSTLCAIINFWVSLILAIGSCIPLIWWYKMVKKSDDIQFLFPYIAQEHSNEYSNITRVNARLSLWNDFDHWLSKSSGKVHLKVPKNPKPRQGVLQRSAYRVGTLRLQVAASTKAALNDENDAKAGLEAESPGISTSTNRQINETHGDFNYSQVITGPRPVTLVLATWSLLCILACLTFAALKYQPHIFEPCLDGILQMDNITTEICTYVPTMSSQKAFHDFLANYSLNNGGGQPGVQSCLGVDMQEFNCSVLLIINTTAQYSAFVDNLMINFNRCPKFPTSVIWFPCDFDVIYQQIYIFTFTLFVMSIVIVSFISSSVPSVKSLRAQKQRLSHLEKEQKTMRHEILLNSNMLAARIREKKKSLKYIIIAIAILVAVFEFFTILSLTLRSHSSDPIAEFFKNWFMLFILHIVTVITGAYISLEMLFENVPRCLNLVNIQLAQLARFLDAISIRTQQHITHPNRLGDWFRVRTFIVKYDQAYLYNSMGGAVGATVLITVVATGYILFQIFNLQSEAHRNIDSFKNGASLINLSIAVYLDLLGIISSWWYLTYYNEIIRWNKEHLITLKHAKADLELRLNELIMSTGVNFSLPSMKNQKRESREDTPRSEDFSASISIKIPEIDIIKNESNASEFESSKMPTIEEEHVMESNSIQTEGSSTKFQNIHPPQSALEHQPSVFQSYKNAIIFYEKIIMDVTDHYYPPTLFGFEYSPAMLTTLKGYIASAVGAIAFFGYKTFF